MFFSAVANHTKLAYAPNAGTTYDVLMGSNPPSILLNTWLPWATELKDRRLANVPVYRAVNYYFAEDGDDTNDGITESTPWASETRRNAICAPLNGNRVNGNALTTATNSGLTVNGRSFWCGAWIDNGDPGSNYYGPVLGVDGSWRLMADTGTNNIPGFGYWIGASPTYFSSGVTLAADTDLKCKIFLQAWFDHTTRLLSVSVNNGTAATTTLADQMDSSVSTFSVGSASGVAFGNGIARGFFVGDMIPTSDQRAAMYNGGRGVRSYTLGSLKSTFVSNSGSFWDFDGVFGTTTYADAISGRTITRSTGQNPTPYLGPDADSISIVDGVVTGGANFALRFKRGDKFTGALNTLRKDIVISDYGSGALPVLTLFDVTISNSWTLVSGTRYKTTLATKPSWVKKVGDDYEPFDLVLAKAADAADCSATANSFWWGSNELHLNVGDDPAIVSASGWEGTTSGTTKSFSALGCYERWQNLILLGSGITEPGNASGYGLVAIGELGEEFVAKGCEFFYTGYHAIGHISESGTATLVDCKAGLCSSRNESGALDQPANGSVYVSYSGLGLQEFIMWNCEVTHGPLPSYDWTTNRDMEAVKQHTDGGPGENAAIQIYYRTTIADSDFSCGQSFGVGQAEIAAITDSTCWVYEPIIGSQYPSGFAITGYSTVFANVDVGATLLETPGYLFGGTPLWLVNCSFATDLTANGGNSYALFGYLAPYVHSFGCRFDYINANGTNWKISDLTITGTEFKNCIITVDGSATKSLGTGASAGMFTNCAFRGLSGVGTGAVDLSSTPSLTVAPSTSSQLFAAGATGVLEYDVNELTRQTTPTIGPIEAA